MISIVVPVRSEKPEMAERFRHLASAPEAELLVADAGDVPETTRAFTGLGARCVTRFGNRGSRLAAAAELAHGEILLFLHGDSDLPSNALQVIRETLSNGVSAGAFSLGYHDADRRMRWIAWWANQRARWLDLPFGDQGIFCHRDVYERAGGFRSLPICEDFDFVRRLRRLGPIVLRPERTLTSPRRYREHGAWRQVLRNWRVLIGFVFGVSPDRLERWYNFR
jgi:uncharacterized protein